MGVGVKGGTEAAVHAVRLAMQQIGPLGTDDGPSPSNANDPRVIEHAAGTSSDPLSLHYHLALPDDVENAFGELLRVPMFGMIQAELSEMFEVAWLLYGQVIFLRFALDNPFDS